jgi:hypothetical protein
MSNRLLHLEDVGYIHPCHVTRVKYKPRNAGLDVLAWIRNNHPSVIRDGLVEWTLSERTN